MNYKKSINILGAFIFAFIVVFLLLANINFKNASAASIQTLQGSNAVPANGQILTGVHLCVNATYNNSDTAAQFKSAKQTWQQTWQSKTTTYNFDAYNQNKSCPNGFLSSTISYAGEPQIGGLPSSTCSTLPGGDVSNLITINAYSSNKSLLAVGQISLCAAYIGT